MIKNFIYLDNQKMFSLSSQVFEGVTEHVLNEASTELVKEDSLKKGLVGNGRIVADVMKETNTSSEKKYLHDYSMVLLENEMIAKGIVLDLTDNKNGFDNIEVDVENFSFIKIKAKAEFIDYKEVVEFMANFYKLRGGLAYLTDSKKVEDFEKTIERIRSKTKQTAADKKILRDSDSMQLPEHYAVENTDSVSPGFLASLSGLIDSCFEGQLLLSQNANNYKFSSYLDRDCLRETERSIISKYARKTSRELVVFGIISQGLGSIASDIKNRDYKGDSMRNATIKFNEHMYNIDTRIAGKEDEEIIIDPVAIYFEL
ncbi:MAG: hypothetical protein CMH98_19030 [Oceanospirillaceae bacterium]|nr:hypothetical protein [Oceanospirillaceae bacterium]